MAKTYTFKCTKCGGETIGVRQTYKVVEQYEPIEFNINPATKAMSPANRISWPTTIYRSRPVFFDGEVLSTEFYCSECGEPVGEDKILIGKQEAYK